MTFLNKLTVCLLLLVLLVGMGCMPPPGGGGQGGAPVNPMAEMIKMLGFMAFFFIIMYVILIRPQRKREQEHAEMVTKLKAGDRVVANGMVGAVVSVKENSVMIRSGDSKLEVLKHAVTEVIQPEGNKQD